MNEARPFAELVTIGRVVKPQGRRGEVLTQPFSDRKERFPALGRAYLPGPDGTSRSVAVDSCWPHKGRFVLKIQGVDSIDEAEKLRGLELRIGPEELEALPADSYYHHELRGLQVFDTADRTLGAVVDLLETGAATVLVIKGERGETLIPLARHFVREVDIARGRMVVTPLETTDAEA